MMEWISCKDALPNPESGFCIVWIKTSFGGNAEFARYEAVNDIWWDVLDNTVEVTHWMPMPEAPV